MGIEKPYQLEKDRVFATGHSVYLKGEKVPTGKVLRVTHISGYHENVKNDQVVEVGYYNGHSYRALRQAPPESDEIPLNWDGNVWLREGQYIYTKLATVADGERMELRAEGHWE